MTIPLFTGGGIYVFIGPLYTFDRKYEIVEKGEGFIPKHFHLEYSVSETPIIPFFLYIVTSKLPKTLNISNHDITYLKTHRGFTHFKVNKLLIIYDNGKVGKLITDDSPDATRVFRITDNWQDAIIHYNAISEKSNFRYHIEGISSSVDSSSYPFEYEEKYLYSYSFRIGLGFEKWAGI